MKATGTVRVRFRPLRPNRSWRPTRTMTSGHPRTAAPAGRRPALDPDALAILHPGGDWTLTDRLRCSIPVPEHVGHGWVTIVPRRCTADRSG